MDKKVIAFDSAASLQKEIYLATPNKKVTIREMTGEDEDIISLNKDAETGESINKFVANVILSPNYTAEQVKSWRLRDKYLVLLEARLLSLGNTMEFKYTFQDGTVQDFEEDLSKYTWDLSPKGREKLPKEGDRNYFNERVKPYPNEASVHEFELKGGQKVGFEYMTGELEAIAIMSDPKDASINDELKNRNFYIEAQGVKTKLENFRVFNSRQMAEIRKEVRATDPEWTGLMILDHPKGKQSEAITIWGVPDFLLPSF